VRVCSGCGVACKRHVGGGRARSPAAGGGVVPPVDISVPRDVRLERGRRHARRHRVQQAQPRHGVRRQTGAVQGRHTGLGWAGPGASVVGHHTRHPHTTTTHAHTLTFSLSLSLSLPNHTPHTRTCTCTRVRTSPSCFRFAFAFAFASEAEARAPALPTSLVGHGQHQRWAPYPADTRSQLNLDAGQPETERAQPQPVLVPEQRHAVAVHVGHVRRDPNV